MSKYNLGSVSAIGTAHEQARANANAEADQGSYNAAWLHGYAAALGEVYSQLSLSGEAVRILNREEYLKIQHFAEHAINGVVEYAYGSSDDTNRVIEPYEMLLEILQKGVVVPKAPHVVPDDVIWALRRLYMAWTEREALLRGVYSDNPKKDSVVYAGAKAQHLDEICRLLSVELFSDKKVIPIPEDAPNKVSYYDMPLWLFDFFRTEYKYAVEKVASTIDLDKEQETWADAKVECIEEVCDVLNIDLTGDNGDLIPAR